MPLARRNADEGTDNWLDEVDPHCFVYRTHIH